MADISAQKVKELRERTGAGMMDCKRALEASDGDLEKAAVWLREKGIASAAKKAGRDAREGLDRQLHPHWWSAGRAHRGQQRDRLRRAQRGVPEAGPRPRDAGRGLAPQYVTIDSIPADVLEAKRAELLADEATQKKPENIRPQIVDGQLRKWQQSVVLYEQPFRDTDRRVSDLITDAIARIGENIRVRRFARYQLGEEI